MYFETVLADFVTERMYLKCLVELKNYAHRNKTKKYFISVYVRKQYFEV